jgi:hypothetical protein
MARTSSSRRIRYSLSSTFTSEPEYFEQDAVADLHVECQALALVVDLAGPPPRPGLPEASPSRCRE